MGVKTQLGIKPTPSMASFSSRGPSSLEPSILKVMMIINQRLGYLKTNLEMHGRVINCYKFCISA